MTANIEGHVCQILHFREAPYTVPNFTNITEPALRALLLKRESGTFAFRNTTELWVRENGKYSIIHLEVRETAIGTLFDGLLYDELVREHSLRYSLWQFYKLDEPSEASRYCYYAEEAIRAERNRPLYCGRASTFSEN